MTILYIISIAVIVIILWFFIDFLIARLLHRKNIQPFKEPPIRKSDVEFFASGDKLFQHLLGEIEQATHHIHILFYIFRDDNIGQKMLDKLKDKANEGVEIRLMVDFMGMKIARKNRKLLKKAGIHFVISNKPSFPFFFYSMNKRNHRKVTVIDGEIAYLGGFNVGDEYLGRDPNFGPWRDYHLAVKGEGVEDLQRQFLLDWKSASSEDLVQRERYYPQQRPGRKEIQILSLDGDHGKEVTLKLINSAKRKLFIGSPYFIPGKEIKDALINAAKRGVDIQVILPKKPDHPLVIHAAYPYFQPLINAGIDIYLYFQGFYHSKAIIIDDKICDIGTANFDQRSFHLNHEVNCLIHDEDWTQQVMEQVDQDLNRSERVTINHLNDRSLGKRLKELVATTFSPLM